MQVKVHSVQFKADYKLVDFVENKLAKLQQFHDHIINSEVFLKLEKDEKHENKIAEIKVNVPGKEMFAKKQCSSFEEATDLAVEALRTQITKFKGKKINH
jgi:putative sigma-54 modulation protein